MVITRFSGLFICAQPPTANEVEKAGVGATRHKNCACREPTAGFRLDITGCQNAIIASHDNKSSIASGQAKKRPKTSCEGKKVSYNRPSFLGPANLTVCVPHRIYRNAVPEKLLRIVWSDAFLKGAVNDGFGVGIPSDFLEGEGGAE